MVSLHEHNEHAAARYPTGGALFGDPQRNGIACPKCGAELWDSSPGTMLATYPPQKQVHCGCGYRGQRIA